MAELKDLIQTADWKKEKHVPVIDAPDSVGKGELFKVTVTVGKEIAHPNTIEHHIKWASLFFLPDGEKFAIQIARTEFTSHGESVVFTHPEASASMKTDKPGTLLASSYCNIHGLWQSARAITLK